MNTIWFLPDTVANASVPAARGGEPCSLKMPDLLELMSHPFAAG
jgi:hypothetical protein